MARKTKEEARKTRRKILAAALDVFSEKGYSRATLVDIAQRIGMTRGAVYWYFEDKRHLLVELMKTMVQRENALVLERAGEPTTLEELRDFYVTRAQIVTTDEESRKFAFFISLQMEWSQETLTFTEKMRDRLQIDPFDNIYATLRSEKERGRLREGVNANAVADVLVAMWRGLIGASMTGFLQSDLLSAISTGFDAQIAAIVRETPEAR